VCYGLLCWVVWRIRVCCGVLRRLRVGCRGIFGLPVGPMPSSLRYRAAVAIEVDVAVFFAQRIASALSLSWSGGASGRFRVLLISGLLCV